MRDRAGPIGRWTVLAARVLPGLLAMRAATAAAPAATAVIDPASVVLYVDEGRLEVEGDGLRNMRIRWQTAKDAGTDACLIPKPSGKRDRCAFTVPRDLPADARLGWAPGATAAGNAAATAATGLDLFTPLRPARIVIDRVLATTTTALDLTDGHGRLPLAHPEAVAAADCAQARCEVSDGAIEVGALSGAAQSVTVHAHLAPHYFVQRGGRLRVDVHAGRVGPALPGQHRLGRAAAAGGGDQRRRPAGRPMRRRRARPALERQRRPRAGRSRGQGRRRGAGAGVRRRRRGRDADGHGVAPRTGRLGHRGRACGDAPRPAAARDAGAARLRQHRLRPHEPRRAGSHRAGRRAGAAGAAAVGGGVQGQHRRRRHAHPRRGGGRRVRGAAFRLSRRGAAGAVRGRRPGRPGRIVAAPDPAGQRPGAHRVVGAGGEPAGRAGLHRRSRQRRSHQARQAHVDRVFATRRLPRRHPPRALQARGRHPGSDAGHRRDQGRRHAALRRARQRTDGAAARVGAAHRLDQRREGPVRSRDGPDRARGRRRPVRRLDRDPNVAAGRSVDAGRRRGTAAVLRDGGDPDRPLSHHRAQRHPDPELRRAVAADLAGPRGARGALRAGAGRDGRRAWPRRPDSRRSRRRWR